MKMFIRSALLGAAGLVALSLPVHAVGSATVADTPLVKSNTTQQQLAQRACNPAPSVSASRVEDEADAEAEALVANPVEQQCCFLALAPEPAAGVALAPS